MLGVIRSENPRIFTASPSVVVVAQFKWDGCLRMPFGGLARQRTVPWISPNYEYNRLNY